MPDPKGRRGDLEPDGGTLASVYCDGKPSLACGGRHDLRFNLAHTDGRVLMAFACHREVGVDLGRLDRNLDWRAVAGRVLSESELQALNQRPKDQQRQAFMQVWVRKEAYAKARGGGFQYGFARFSVAMTDLDKTRTGSALLADDTDANAADEWSLFDLEMPSAFVGAMSIQGGHPVPMACWAWSGKYRRRSPVDDVDGAVSHRPEASDQRSASRPGNTLSPVSAIRPR